MVLLQINPKLLPVLKREGDAPRPIDMGGVSFWLALQTVEVVAGDIQLLGQAGNFHQLQDANALSGVIGADPACVARQIKFFQSFVPERPDHCPSVDYLVYSFNCHSCPTGVDPKESGEKQIVCGNALCNRDNEFLAERVEGFGDAVYFGCVREGGQPVDFLLAGFQAPG